MATKQLLELRKEIKQVRKPTFVRQEGLRRARLAVKWRQPKGMHSKLRRKFRGRMHHPTPSYSSPRAVRNLHRTGLKMALVSNLNDLTALNPKETGIIMSRTLGLRKKLSLLRKCQELQFTVLNIKRIEEFIKCAEEKKAKKKEESENKAKVKEESKEGALKKAEEKKEEEKQKESKKEEKEPSLLEDETKKGQKSEKIKILEQKG